MQKTQIVQVFLFKKKKIIYFGAWIQKQSVRDENTHPFRSTKEKNLEKKKENGERGERGEKQSQKQEEVCKLHCNDNIVICSY